MIYFSENNILYCGLQNNKSANTTPVIYSIGQNVISSNLKYKNGSDIKMRVKAIAIDSKNNTIEEILGDENEGDSQISQKVIKTYYSLPFLDEGATGDGLNGDQIRDEIKIRAIQELNKYKYTGHDGSLTGFLVPYCLPNYIINLKNTEKEGLFWVDAVKVTYGQNGARRILEIGSEK